MAFSEKFLRLPIDGVTELWLDTDMSNTATTTRQTISLTDVAYWDGHTDEALEKLYASNMADSLHYRLNGSAAFENECMAIAMAILGQIAKRA